MKEGHPSSKGSPPEVRQSAHGGSSVGRDDRLLIVAALILIVPGLLMGVAHGVSQGILTASVGLLLIGYCILWMVDFHGLRLRLTERYYGWWEVRVGPVRRIVWPLIVPAVAGVGIGLSFVIVGIGQVSS